MFGPTYFFKDFRQKIQLASLVVFDEGGYIILMHKHDESTRNERLIRSWQRYPNILLRPFLNTIRQGMLFTITVTCIR